MKKMPKFTKSDYFHQSNHKIFVDNMLFDYTFNTTSSNKTEGVAEFYPNCIKSNATSVVK